jgi:hypothetical protein
MFNEYGCDSLHQDRRGDHIHELAEESALRLAGSKVRVELFPRRKDSPSQTARIPHFPPTKIIQPTRSQEITKWTKNE